MSEFVFVTAASDSFFRSMVANLILSSRDFGKYNWYVVADESLRLEERFRAMSPDHVKKWASSEAEKFWMKFGYMKAAFADGSWEYAVWLDADSEFHGPPQIDRLLDARRKAFCLLESDVLGMKANWIYNPENLRAWLDKLNYHGPAYYNVNGGFMVIRRDAFDEAMALFHRAVETTLGFGWKPETDELYFSYVVHVLNSDLDNLLMERNLDVFMCTNGYPRPKGFWRYGTGHTLVLPARVPLGIVHHMGCDEQLAEMGRKRLSLIG